jgi:glutathione S-transferase
MSADRYTLFIGNRNYSTWSMRGWLALKLSGLAFDEVVVPLYTQESAALLAKYSPTGRVPCLKRGDLVIWDSLAIAEYAAERAPDSGLWPVGPDRRARARSVVAEMHSGFLALRARFSMDMVRRHYGMLPTAAEEADIDRIDRLWSECLKSSGGPFLFGDWTLADCFYAPVVSRFETYGFATSLVSTAYRDAVRAHPHYREWQQAAEAEPWSLSLEQLAGV